jgi:hypothetical protein
MRRAFLALATLCALGCGTAEAAPELAKKRALDAMTAARDGDWRVSDFSAQGALKPGANVVLRFTFLSSMTYRLVVAGCEECTDIDAALYDEKGQLVVHDKDAGAVAILERKPAWTGTYFLKITLRRAAASGAHYFVQYAYD